MHSGTLKKSFFTSAGSRVEHANAAPVEILTKSESERLLKLLALRTPENLLSVLEDSEIEPLPISSALEALAEEGSDVRVCITPRAGRLHVALTMVTRLDEAPPANFSNEWSADLYDALYTNFLNTANESPDHSKHLDALLVTAGEIKLESEVAVEPIAPTPKVEAPKPLEVNLLFGDGPIKILTESLALKLLRLLAREMPAAKMIINGANNVNGQLTPSYLTPAEVLTRWLNIAKDKKPKNLSWYRRREIRTASVFSAKIKPLESKTERPI